MPKVVIGFAGRKHSGKSAVSSMFVKEYGAVRSSFADPLKKMLKTLGLQDDQLWGNLKETPDFEILGGKTPRWAMQTLGTEWGRHAIWADLWATAWKRATVLEKPTFTVIEDVRFPNEVQAIRALGGIVIGLEREDVSILRHLRETAGFIHESENFGRLVRTQGIPVVPNTGSLVQTMEHVMEIARPLIDAKLPRSA